MNYSVCDLDFSFNFETANVAAFTMSMVDSNCPSEDFIRIESSSGLGTLANLRNRFCGGILSDTDAVTANQVIKDCTEPFQVCFVTDDTEDGTVTTVTNGNRGFCLDFRQEPCQATM